MRSIADLVVVVTGASSGIGRATAVAFAERGATVVLAARRRQPLFELADDCQHRGGRALAVPTDVTDEDAVKALAKEAVEEFGRIDVWFNNAGVSLFSRFEEVPLKAFRQVMETNFFGYVYGARAVLPYFREQGQGVLINNASMLAKGGAPYLSAYVSSKFAIYGFGESLRQELRDENIHVCTLMPASIDTPIFQHAANHTGRAIKPLNPIYPVEEVVRVVLALARNPQKEVFAGSAGRVMGIIHHVSPELYERVMAPQVERDHFQDRYEPPHEGNLFRPGNVHTGPSGGWLKPGEQRESSSLPLALGLGVLLTTALGLGWYLAQDETTGRKK